MSRGAFSATGAAPSASIARPPVLSAIAVLGIIVAALSIVASLLTAGYGAGAYVASNAARAAILRNAPAALPVSRADQRVLLSIAVEQPVGDKGLDAPRRAMVIGAIQQRIQMTPEQSRQLDALLAGAGQELFQGMPDSPDAVLEAVGDRYGLLATSDADAASPFYFQTAAGRADVYADRALFTRHNTLMPMRFSGGRDRNDSGHPILLRQDVDKLVALAQQSCAAGPTKQNLNEAQVRALRALLADARQQLVGLNQNGDTATIGIDSASIHKDGYASVFFADGPVLLSPDGKVILRGNVQDIPMVSPVGCGLTIVEGLLSVGLAVFLLVIAVQLLRRPRRPLRPFLWYAAVKPVLAIGGGSALGWTIASYAVNVQRKAEPTSMAYAAAIALAIAGCAFPLALLLVARLRSVREFYHPR